MRLPLLALLLATAACAQDTKSKIVSEQLAPGLHVLSGGGGGNVAVSTGADGTVLIDDEYPEVTPSIVAAAAKLSPGPVRFLINTHWHGDHSGGNEQLGKGGTVIVAHDNVRIRMGTEQFTKAFNRKVPASPAAALPVVTFASTATLHLNGDDIRAVHVPAAHTDGDSLVVFSKANVIHMGDNYFSRAYPFIDLSSGGRVAGVVEAADRALALGNDATRYIPGHGPVTGRSDLIAYRAMLADVIARVGALVAAGRSADEIVAAQPTAAHDAKWGGSFMTPEKFTRIVAESLQSDAKAAR